jgi:hypothetical protein
MVEQSIFLRDSKNSPCFVSALAFKSELVIPIFVDLILKNLYL